MLPLNDLIGVQGTTQWSKTSHVRYEPRIGSKNLTVVLGTKQGV